MQAVVQSQQQVLTSKEGLPLPFHRLTEQDIPALIEFGRNLSEKTRQLFLPHTYDKDTIYKYVERDKANLDRIYVLKNNHAVIGYFFLWEFDTRVPLLGVGLADTWQGQGLGEKMLDQLISDARNQNRTGVELTTVTTNERAYKLYQKKGFELLETVNNIAGDGRVVREYRMFLPLISGAQPFEREFKPPV